MKKQRRGKVAGREGGGPPPGYRWSVFILDVAYREAETLLTPDQMEHVRIQISDLARHRDPTHSRTLSVDKIEDFYELREKGGVLGSTNLRVFFGVDKRQRVLVILGTIKKERDGPTPLGDKVTMRRRWRKYCEGDYGQA